MGALWGLMRVEPTAQLHEGGVATRMSAVLAHRGDVEVRCAADGVVLASRRFEERRASLADGRLFRSEDGTIQAVADGSLLGHERLGNALRREGHRLDPTVNGSAIPHLYEEDGLDFLHRLRGDVSVALWDEREARGVV